jgi:hypothetical protein
MTRQSAQSAQSVESVTESEEIMQQSTESGVRPTPTSQTSRRTLLRTGAALGAGALGAGIFANGRPTYAAVHATSSRHASSRVHLSKGDAAILRILAALEILETDLWQQYNELGGIQDSEVPGGSGNTGYTAALQNLDGDMPQYIHDNTEDEFTHFTFLNAYLVAHGADPVTLDQFRTLPSSQATGANKTAKRLTNLMQLTVDTSYWTRYRSGAKNPDFGDFLTSAIPDLVNGQFPAIPRDDNDVDTTTPSTTTMSHIQAIANTAAFHFAFIEQGGTSLYPALAQRVSDKEVLRVLLSIGPTETAHFQTWHDKAGNAVVGTDPKNAALTFPNLNANPPTVPGVALEDVQTNLIMPEPTIFLSRKFPVVSIIRPTETEGAAMGAVKALTDDGLFIGQSKAFFDFLHALAKAADDAHP